MGQCHDTTFSVESAGWSQCVVQCTCSRPAFRSCCSMEMSGGSCPAQGPTRRAQLHTFRIHLHVKLRRMTSDKSRRSTDWRWPGDSDEINEVFSMKHCLLLWRTARSILFDQCAYVESYAKISVSGGPSHITSYNPQKNNSFSKGQSCPWIWLQSTRTCTCNLVSEVGPFG